MVTHKCEQVRKIKHTHNIFSNNNIIMVSMNNTNNIDENVILKIEQCLEWKLSHWNTVPYLDPIYGG